MKKIISAFMALPFLAVSAFSDEGLSPQQMEKVHEAYKDCKELAKLGYMESSKCEKLNPDNLIKKTNTNSSDSSKRRLVWGELSDASETVILKMQEKMVAKPKSDESVCSLGEHKALELVDEITGLQDEIAGSDKELRKRDKFKQGLRSIFEKGRNQCK